MNALAAARRTRRMALLGAVVIATSGCIAIDQQFQIRADGSGIVTLRYAVSHSVAAVGTGSDGRPVPVLPISRDELEQSVAGSEGVTLQRYSASSDADNVYVDAQIAFTSVPALAATPGFAPLGLSLIETDDRVTFAATTIPGRAETIAADALTTIETFFGDYEIVFRVEAPRAIVTVSGGTLVSERVAEFSLPVSDVVSRLDAERMTVIW